MRDAKDPGTVEMRFRMRAGRPALFGTAMSAAERARRYRQRKAERMKLARRSPERASEVGLLDELRACMAAGHAVSVHKILGEIAARYPMH